MNGFEASFSTGLSTHDHMIMYLILSRVAIRMKLGADEPNVPHLPISAVNYGISIINLVAY